MDVFSYLFVMGLGSFVDEDKMDIIRKLPIEISTMILRMLDGGALLNVQKVSKRWYNICQSDKILRQKIRNYKREQKIKKGEIVFGQIGELRTVPKDESTAFRLRTIQMNTNNKPSIQAGPVITKIESYSRNEKLVQKRKTSDVPFVVLGPNGITEFQCPGKRKRDGVQGIGREQKRRLRRL